MRYTWILLLTAAFVLPLGCDREDKPSTVEGQGETALTLEPIDDVELVRGQVTEVTIKIDRQNLEGAVSVSFQKLPEGVTVLDADKQIVGDEGAYNLKASENATLVSGYQAWVEATAPSGIGVKKSMMVTVTAPE
jgi:hypothetical protein